MKVFNVEYESSPLNEVYTRKVEAKDIGSVNNLFFAGMRIGGITIRKITEVTH